jgi:hypothetical protein
MIHDHCVVCGTADNLNQHHLIPRSLGGSDEESNLLTLCGPCHAKVHQVSADWRHSELIRKAINAKRSRNEFTGTANFGYCIASDNKTLIEDANEQKIIAIIYKCREGDMSLRAIVSRLNEQGTKSRSGKPLGVTQVARIVNAKAARAAAAKPR